MYHRWDTCYVYEGRGGGDVCDAGGWRNREYRFVKGVKMR